jgi:rubrerythrin
MTGIEEFSGFEAVRAAMEVEKNGYRFYSTMSQKARSPLAKEIFAWLAQDEVGHLATLEKMMTQYAGGEFWEDEETFLPYLRRFSEKDIFPSAERLEKILQSDNFDILSLDLAIEAEDRFAEYFRRAAEHSKSTEGKGAFSWLAEEEERHARQLRERKEKIVSAQDKISGER